MFNETHSAQRAMLIRDIIAKLRHDGCGGRAGEAELLNRHRGRQQPAGAPDRAVVVSPTELQNHQASRQFLLGATRV